jgi:hypothetical protein
MSLCDQCYSSLKDHELVADVSSNNDSEVEYFDVYNKKSGKSVVSSMQLETENTETEVTTFSSRIATLC